MIKVSSREYKLLVNHEPFSDLIGAVKTIWNEIEEVVGTESIVRVKGKFDELETRRIVFLDTPDHTLRQNGFVFRQRSLEEASEYTLKCRSEDRYFAAGADVRAANRLSVDRKFEEDIAPPFTCRFSHSATVTISGRKTTPRKMPKRLAEAAELFPVLTNLHANGQPCSSETDLGAVNGIVVDESVWKGGNIIFEQGGGAKSEATVALILWTHGKKDRPVIAELSFRVKNSEEHFTQNLAESARSVYTLLQRLDCARREGMTKTEYIYRDASRD